MQVVFHSSVRTTFYPFGHPSPRKRFWLQYSYSTSIVHRTQKKKLNWPSISTQKKIYSGFRLQYYYDAWDLKKSISLDHCRKKIYFRFRLQYYWMHRTQKIFNRHSTPPKEKLFLATVILWSTGHRNYNV